MIHRSLWPQPPEQGKPAPKLPQKAAKGAGFCRFWPVFTGRRRVFVLFLGVKWGCGEAGTSLGAKRRSPCATNQGTKVNTKRIVMARVNGKIHTFELVRGQDQWKNSVTAVMLVVPGFRTGGTEVPPSTMLIGQVIALANGDVNCTIDHVGTHVGNRDERSAFVKVLTSSPWLH